MIIETKFDIGQILYYPRNVMYGGVFYEPQEFKVCSITYNHLGIGYNQCHDEDGCYATKEECQKRCDDLNVLTKIQESMSQQDAVDTDRDVIANIRGDK